ncbi:hypothetical protein [Streptomyces sp. NPDC059009]|uniref:hypothetical protein n=1 Tax=Streptomyces sp. NPDC059009 TaxID=3346694 RepID=UPI00367ABCCD
MRKKFSAGSAGSAYIAGIAGIAALGIISGAAGCAREGAAHSGTTESARSAKSAGGGAKSARSAHSGCAPEFTWNTPATGAWTLAVLDDRVAVAPGGTLKIKAKPYRPRTAEVTGVRAGGPRAAEVMKALSEKTGTPLAAPGARTADIARTAEVGFPASGPRAEAVYYQGLRLVETDYRYRCADESRGRGHIRTWETRSETAGLVDCLKPAAENPRTALARLATRERCPAR